MEVLLGYFQMYDPAFDCANCLHMMLVDHGVLKKKKLKDDPNFKPRSRTQRRRDRRKKKLERDQAV